MKAQVCKMANEFIKNGISRKEAFVKAWALTKIEKLEEVKFNLNMKDLWNDEDRKNAKEISNKIAELCERAKTATEKEAECKAEEEKELAKQNAEQEFMESIGFVWSEEQNVWLPTAA